MSTRTTPCTGMPAPGQTKSRQYPPLHVANRQSLETTAHAASIDAPSPSAADLARFDFDSAEYEAELPADGDGHGVGPTDRAASSVGTVPADPPTVAVYRVPASAKLPVAQDLPAVLRSAATNSGGGMWRACLDIKDVPAARLQRCAAFVHVVDDAADAAAARLAAQLAEEEAAHNGKELHSQLIHALTAARQEAAYVCVLLGRFFCFPPGSLVRSTHVGTPRPCVVRISGTCGQTRSRRRPS